MKQKREKKRKEKKGKEKRREETIDNGDSSVPLPNRMLLGEVLLQQNFHNQSCVSEFRVKKDQV